MRFTETTLAMAIGGASVLAGAMLAAPGWNAVPCADGFRGRYPDPDNSPVADRGEVGFRQWPQEAPRPSISPPSAASPSPPCAAADES